MLCFLEFCVLLCVCDETMSRRGAWPLNIICLRGVHIHVRFLFAEWKLERFSLKKKCLFCMTASEMPDSNFHGDVWLSCQLISGSYLPILNYFWWLIICMRRIASVCLVIIFEMGNLRIRNDRNQSETVCTWFGHAWLG